MARAPVQALSWGRRVRRRSAFEKWAREWSSSGRTRPFAIRDAGSRELVGGCQVRLQDKSAAISYWVFPTFRRRGFATRALRLVSSWAMAELEIEKLEVRVEPDNLASRRTAERAGFHEEALFPQAETIGGEPRDMLLYALSTNPP